MQQHLMQMQPMMAAYYPSNVTTDHIQQDRYRSQIKQGECKNGNIYHLTRPLRLTKK